MIGGLTWIDARGMQCFTGIDIADANDHFGIHDEIFDSQASSGRTICQPLSIEIIAQRFGAQMGQEGKIFRILLQPENGAEATSIIEAQGQAILEDDIDMIMRLCRCCGRQDTQFARHAQMQADMACRCCQQ